MLLLANDALLLYSNLGDGATVHVRGAESPDGQPGVCADLDAAAVTDLDLAPGQEVYFVVDEAQVRLCAALTRN